MIPACCQLPLPCTGFRERPSWSSTVSPKRRGFGRAFAGCAARVCRPWCRMPSRSASRRAGLTTIREPMPGITSSVGSRRRRPGSRLLTTCHSLHDMLHQGSIGSTRVPWGQGRKANEAQPKEAKLQSGSYSEPNQSVQATADSPAALWLSAAPDTVFIRCLSLHPWSSRGDGRHQGRIASAALERGRGVAVQALTNSV
jgi:hypothetical protein